MNIFVIPSWYPSKDAPLSGVFTKEQVLSILQFSAQHNFGISLWGQRDEATLLWTKDHFRNIKKLFFFLFFRQTENHLHSHYSEFYTPALTWTNWLLEGNLKNIIRANGQNLQRFEAKFGKVSLIHAHVAFPGGYIAMELAKKYKIPYIITEHMGPFPLPSFIGRKNILWKIKNSLQNARFVISVSPQAGSDIKNKTGVDPLIIPNLVNENLFSVLPKNNRYPSFTFFTLGRIDKQKGIPDLLEAIELMEDKEALFRIGGDGESKKEYEKLAEELNIADRIQWLGELSRTEAAKEFQQCHAFVLPSIHESMGVVYAEAIACGKPIIATRCGGPESIVNQNNGLLVNINSPQQLAQAMDCLIKNYDRYQPEVIRKDFMERFSSEVVTKKIVSVYEAVVANKPLPAEWFPNR